MIGIDATVLEGGFGGVKTYLSNLLKYWHGCRLYFRDSIPLGYERFDCRLVRPKRPWNLYTMPKEMLKIDTFFSPYYFLPYFVLTDSVVTIHDISFESHPEWYDKSFTRYIRHRVRLSVKKARTIITDCNHSKTEIMKYYNVPDKKIKVIPLGVDEFYYPRIDNEVQRKYNIKGRYVLNVGSMFKRRHVDRIVRACKDIDAKLVLIGQNPCNIDIRGAIHYEHVPQEDMPYLYSGASLFVTIPSYDGYCLPLLEAMACGVPCITSSLSVLPDIGGYAPIYVNPYNTEELRQAIKQVLNSSKLQLDMSWKSVERAREFSWKKCAKETARILEDR